MHFINGTSMLQRTAAHHIRSHIRQHSPLTHHSGIYRVSAAGMMARRYGDSTFASTLSSPSSPSSGNSSSSSSSSCCHKEVAPTAADTVQPILSNAADGSPTEKGEKKSCHKQAAAHGRPSAPAVNTLQFWSDPSSWKIASTNTFRCLIGCTLGDLSMLFYLQSAHPTMSPPLAMGLAMTSGILTSITLETLVLRFSNKVRMPWSAALKTATGMSMISMLTMEAVENAVDYHLMGWGNVNLSDPMFWNTIGWSALAGWSAPLPFNYWNLKRHGKSCH
ncbi:hypothetical protein EMPS_03414 [Entomortierella parvispora]|uniref:DUF4396 domain-containing protein n=1 Tax=Entomortierella parvispora TaxID=205924 RepID=A0A9P3LUL7_9FUNG|nr:hypothetical protein EMPS_03414 [Entomortierella parvispora]